MHCSQGMFDIQYSENMYFNTEPEFDIYQKEIKECQNYGIFKNQTTELFGGSFYINQSKNVKFCNLTIYKSEATIGGAFYIKHSTEV